MFETMLQWDSSENSLAVLCVLTAVGTGSIPGLRTKDPAHSPPPTCHAAGQKKKKKKKPQQFFRVI